MVMLAADLLGLFLFGAAFVFDVLLSVHMLRQVKHHVGELLRAHGAEDIPVPRGDRNEHPRRHAGSRC